MNLGAQGIGGCIQGTNTIFFVHKDEVPPDRWKDITYAKFVCELKPNKAEVHRTRLMVGGDKVHYPGDEGSSVKLPCQRYDTSHSQ